MRARGVHVLLYILLRVCIQTTQLYDLKKLMAKVIDSPEGKNYKLK